jgi:hypothetical protein
MRVKHLRVGLFTAFLAGAAGVATAENTPQDRRAQYPLGSEAADLYRDREEPASAGATAADIDARTDAPTRTRSAVTDYLRYPLASEAAENAREALDYQDHSRAQQRAPSRRIAP